MVPDRLDAGRLVAYLHSAADRDRQGVQRP